MKRLIYILFAVAILAGCDKEISTIGGPRQFTVIAGQLNDVVTRTYINSPNPSTDPTNPAGRIVFWNSGDEIAIYDDKVHEFVCHDNAGTSSIRGEVSEGFTGSTYYGLYPYSSYVNFTDGVFSSSIPANQELNSQFNWDPKAPVAVGSCSVADSTIVFYNANSLIELYLPASASQVSIRCYGANDYISGDIDVNVSSLAVTPGEYKYTMVTLLGDLQANTPYFIALTPATATAGFSINVNYKESFTMEGVTYEAGEHAYRNIKNGKVFARDRITVINLLEVSPTNPASEEAIKISNHIPLGSYILRSIDGSVSLSVEHQGADKAFWMSFKVYDYDRETLLDPVTDLEGYQINNGGGAWTEQQVSNNPYCYRLKLKGSGAYNGAYLKYDPELQAFVMVRNESEATVFYFYSA